MVKQHAWSDYPEAAEAISVFISAAKAHIGDYMMSIVLFGGLVRGEWVPKTSDIDLVLVLSRPISVPVVRGAVEAFLDALDRQDERFKRWIYVYILSRDALLFPQYRCEGGPEGLRYGNLKRREFRGFPMSAFDALDLREHGLVLEGEDLLTEFPAASRDELEAATIDSLLMGIRRARDWRLPVEIGVDFDLDATVGYIAWVCRSLFWQVHPGELAAKGQAMQWALEVLPREFHRLLRSCLLARFGPGSLSAEDRSAIMNAYASFYWYGARTMLRNLGMAVPKEERPPLGTDGRYDFSEIEKLAELSVTGR
jgi:predicted nucleotidyltransferase